MSADGETRSRPDAPLASNSPREFQLTLPSWAVSVGVHALLLLLFATTLKSCGGGGMNQLAGENFRTVGLVDRDSKQTHDEVAPDPRDDTGEAGEKTNNTNPNEVAKQPFSLDDEPPIDLNLPQPNRPVIGSGAAATIPSGGLPNDIIELIKPNNIGGAAAFGGLAEGETEFFGIRDKGTQFAYVVDRSGSMRGKPLQKAKLELMASLGALRPTQRAQVVFYSDKVRVMRVDNEQLFWATKLNLAKARQQLGSTESDDGGTNHVIALKSALSTNPDVVYFLTDGENLDRRRLEDIKRANRSGARIHCVQFGRGPASPVTNYLERLARENGGAYRYRDASRLNGR
jgi:Ca-activated chloride channel family protein